MTLVELYLASVGLTSIITFSVIGDAVLRAVDPANRVPMLRCPQCVGFWVGLGMGLLADQGARALLTGFAVSVLSRAAASTIERIER